MPLAAARRDYFAGSNSGVVGQDLRDVGDVVKKFTLPGGWGAGVTSRSGASSSEWGPPHATAFGTKAVDIDQLPFSVDTLSSVAAI